MESTTATTGCIWALLTRTDLKFINSSRDNDKLKGQSLFNFIHPDEVSLAKRDLYKFMNSDLLGGSVTRCRLRDHDTSTITNDFVKWVVVDVIIYVATENLVLAFFHRQQDLTLANCCGNHPFIKNHIRHLYHQLSENVAILHRNDSKNLPNQIFHILDNSNKSVLLSWPPLVSSDQYLDDFLVGGAQMTAGRLEGRHRSNNCFHCVQEPIRFIPSGEKISCFVIEYGLISFILTHIERPSKSPSLALLPTSPTVGTYQKRLNRSQSDHRSSSSNTNSTAWYNGTNHSNGVIRRTSTPSSPIIKRQQQQRSSPSNSTPTRHSIKLESLLLPPSSPPAVQKFVRNHCQSCGTDSSPEWRRGPTGHKALCNACGLRYSRSVARQGKLAARQQQMMFPGQNMMTATTAPQSPASCSSYSSSSGSLSPLFNMDCFKSSNSSYHCHQSDSSNNMSSSSSTAAAYYSSTYHSNTTNANDTKYYYNSNNSISNNRHHKHNISFAVL